MTMTGSNKLIDQLFAGYKKPEDLIGENGLRKVTKSRCSFSGEKALLNLFYSALNNISKNRTMPLRDWKAALTRFTIQLESWMTNA